MSVREGGREARTGYVVERVYEDPAVSLLECHLETGRTHQIRVHLAHLGFPVSGDRIYLRGSRRRGAGPPVPGLQSRVAALGGHALHAGLLGFRHPVTGDALRFEAPPPPAFAALLDWLRTGAPA